MTVDEETPLLRDAGTASGAISNDTSSSGQEYPRDENGVLKPQASMVTVIFPMMLGIFLMAMDSTIVASTYASIGSQFEQLQNTSWIATGYMLTMTSFQPLYGKLSDIFGRKACLIFAYLVFALGSLFCGLASSMTGLIAARALAGIGGGGMTTVASIIMSDVVPLRKRGTWQGICNIAFASGQATGAPLGGLLADTIGWRWAFLIQVPMTVLAILSVSLGLKLPQNDQSDFMAKLKRVDFTGAVTLVVAVFALLLGLDRGGNISWTDHTAIASFVVFGVLFVTFMVIELRLASEPFAPKHIIVNKTLFASYCCNFFVAGAMLVTVFHVSLYLQAVQGMNAAQVGLALLPSVIGGVLGSLLSGLLMQATGKYHTLSITVFLMMLAGSSLIASVTGPWKYTFAGLAVGLAANNFGGGAGITTTLIALIANAGPEDQAVATAGDFISLPHAGLRGWIVSRNHPISRHTSQAPA
ncbi:hypothetical protein AcW2_000569 [Taiwanofungus camphoratus]|nr:hypothetical protein AcW2_000569 [Antrodia cinnamomea]